MNRFSLQIDCRDPIVSRDGRPFGAGQGNRMRSAGWPLPSMIAGSLRTALAKTAGRGDFRDPTPSELLKTAVAGAFPVSDGVFYLPAPLDCVVAFNGEPMRSRPQPAGDGAGCDWPVEGLAPVMLSDVDAGRAGKTIEPPAWWPIDRYAQWLCGKPIAFDSKFLLQAEAEERTHVSMNAESGAADEGHLFTTSGLALGRLPKHGGGASWRDRFAKVSLACQVAADGWCAEATEQLSGPHPTGGERRLAHWRHSPGSADLWRCPQEVSSHLSGSRKVMMALATPAIFSGGWRPGWLNDDLTGSPPGGDVKLRLAGVSIGRWRAVSGWSLANLPGQPRGPKPVRRMVGAGGVYFFHVEGGDAQSLAGQWLAPVSDDEQDRRDGFGLAAWGIW